MAKVQKSCYYFKNLYTPGIIYECPGFCNHHFRVYYLGGILFWRADLAYCHNATPIKIQIGDKRITWEHDGIALGFFGMGNSGSIWDPYTLKTYTSFWFEGFSIITFISSRVTLESC